MRAARRGAWSRRRPSDQQSGWCNSTPPRIGRRGSGVARRALSCSSPPALRRLRRVASRHFLSFPLRISALATWLIPSGHIGTPFASRLVCTSKHGRKGVEMADNNRTAELREKTQRLLHGALRHARAAALAATLVPLGTVAVSPSVAQDCGSAGCPPAAAVPSPCDFVTSGGFVVTDSMTMANFGAHGGCKKGAFWGHVNYVDHAGDYHVDSTRITGY